MEVNKNTTAFANIARLAVDCDCLIGTTPLNISKLEQRVLHVLSQGGRIAYVRNVHGKVIDVTCFSREGFVLTDCKLDVFKKLKKRGFVKSYGGRAYRITRKGRQSVRPQFDNR